jgi:hypothetical protein
MALKLSTGLRNKMLDTGSFKTIMNGGLLKIYKGTPPNTADDIATAGDLLCTVSVNSTGTGITMAASAVSGTLAKNSSEVWSGSVGLAGTATWFRHVATSDTAASSTTEARLQGVVATAGGELNLSSTGLSAGATQTIDYYTFALPTL